MAYSDLVKFVFVASWFQFVVFRIREKLDLVILTCVSFALCAITRMRIVYCLPDAALGWKVVNVKERSYIL